MTLIYNSKNNRICTTTSNYSKTYVIWTSKRAIDSNFIICNSLSSNDNDSLHIWHRRLAYYSLGPLHNTLSKIDIKCQCKTCAKTKLKNFPHKSSNSRASEPFDLVHMDTISINNISLYSNKYFISILDDYTRFAWVLFIKFKDQVFDAFLSWYKILKIFLTNL